MVEALKLVSTQRAMIGENGPIASSDAVMLYATEQNKFRGTPSIRPKPPDDNLGTRIASLRSTIMWDIAVGLICVVAAKGLDLLLNRLRGLGKTQQS
jgi:hypothetical protein